MLMGLSYNNLNKAYKQQQQQRRILGSNQRQLVKYSQKIASTVVDIDVLLDKNETKV
uniref:Uncharacterized protein n=1 Tax=Romanomermis culicivorax TaxID=13658 RepID=A0A915HMA9_ROMCU